MCAADRLRHELQEEIGGEVDIVYLIHLDDRVGRPQSAEAREAWGLGPRVGEVHGAGHYMGATQDLAGRIQAHALSHGARLLRAANAQGIGWHVARVWIGPRGLERRLKAQRNHARLCPTCADRAQQPTYDNVIELAEAQIAEALTAF